MLTPPPRVAQDLAVAGSVEAGLEMVVVELVVEDLEVMGLAVAEAKTTHSDHSDLDENARPISVPRLLIRRLNQICVRFSRSGTSDACSWPSRRTSRKTCASQMRGGSRKAPGSSRRCKRRSC